MGWGGVGGGMYQKRSHGVGELAEIQVGQTHDNSLTDKVTLQTQLYIFIGL